MLLGCDSSDNCQGKVALNIEARPNSNQHLHAVPLVVYLTSSFSCCPPSSLLPHLLLPLSSLPDNSKHHTPVKGYHEQTLSSKAQEWHTPTLPPTPEKKTGIQIFAWITKYMAPMKFTFSPPFKQIPIFHHSWERTTSRLQPEIIFGSTVLVAGTTHELSIVL